MYELKKKTPKVVRKSKGAGKNLRPVERDFEILRFILEMKSCCSEQIWERFFKRDGIGLKYCQNRLSRLRSADYLMSHYTYDGPVRYYTGTRKAKDMVMNFYGLDEGEIADGRDSVELKQFIHDKGLVWIRVFMENLGVLEPWVWDSELSFKFRELAGKSVTDLRLEVIPDAIIEVEEESGVHFGAVEFEHTIKNKQKRKDKVRNLFLKEKYGELRWSCKIFIFANAAVEKAYKETFREVFLERAKKFDFSKRDWDFDRNWEEELKYFGSQYLLCGRYDDLVEHYKKGAKLNLKEFLKRNEIFEEARNVLRDGMKKRNAEIEKKREVEQEMEAGSFRGKKEESKGFLGSLFS